MPDPDSPAIRETDTWIPIPDTRLTATPKETPMTDHCYALRALRAIGHDANLPAVTYALLAIHDELWELRQALTSTETAQKRDLSDAGPQTSPVGTQASESAPEAILDEPPIGSRITDEDGDVWERQAGGWRVWVPGRLDWEVAPVAWSDETDGPRGYTPLRPTTPDDLARVGITKSEDDWALAKALRHTWTGGRQWAEATLSARANWYELARVVREHIEQNHSSDAEAAAHAETRKVIEEWRTDVERLTVERNDARRERDKAVHLLGRQTKALVDAQAKVKRFRDAIATNSNVLRQAAYTISAGEVVDHQSISPTLRNLADLRTCWKVTAMSEPKAVYTLVWDGEPKMGGGNHRQQMGEWSDIEQARQAMHVAGTLSNKPGLHIERRYVTEWEEIDNE